MQITDDQLKAKLGRVKARLDDLKQANMMSKVTIAEEAVEETYKLLLAIVARLTETNQPTSEGTPEQ